MIASLTGQLTHHDSSTNESTIVVNGIGYFVQTGKRAAATIPKVGEELTLHTHLHVREDAQLLFGFLSVKERKVFRTLISISGVGPATALAMLDTFTPGELQTIAATEDRQSLQSVPGIGAKTAASILLHLQSKLDFDDIEPEEVGGRLPLNAEVDEVGQALQALGYEEAQIEAAIAQLPDEGTSAELTTRALKLIADAG